MIFKKLYLLYAKNNSIHSNILIEFILLKYKTQVACISRSKAKRMRFTQSPPNRNLAGYYAHDPVIHHNQLNNIPSHSLVSSQRHTPMVQNHNQK